MDRVLPPVHGKHDVCHFNAYTIDDPYLLIVLFVIEVHNFSLLMCFSIALGMYSIKKTLILIEPLTMYSAVFSTNIVNILQMFVRLFKCER